MTALETLDPSALIPLDKTYKSRLALRRDLLESYPDVVLGVDDPSDPRIRLAVDEYYTFILGTYLPTRYPGVFQLHPGTGTVGEGKTQIPTQMLENRATGEFWPVSTPDTDTGTGTGTKTQLSILSRLIDEDILFLLPSSPPGAGAGAGPGPGEEKYSLKAYSTCFPSGFNPAQKLGLRLADIHGPVPGYEQKLEKSMDRFFAKLEVGRYVKRVNWSVTTDTGLFAAFGGIHGDKDEGEDGKDGNRALKAEELDLDTVCALFQLFLG